jgi:tRNA threonylcarbamoyladenosine biosynthesis protein TsaE
MHGESDLKSLLRETTCASQTEALGGQLAGWLSAGDLVLVRGELGAGKTTLVRGLARALGVSGPVTSPTFSIGHRYQGTSVTVCHLDLYRLRSLSQEDPALLDDYLDGRSVVLVEWPQVAGGELPQARLVVTLDHMGGDNRRIQASPQ